MFRAYFLNGLLAVIAMSFYGCASIMPAGPQIDAVGAASGIANRFQLANLETEVVGELTVVIAQSEDTLPALARRYGVGYDEIVGANPGVDTWLPGAGTQVVLPTRFVLPDAPRQGVVINVAARRLFYFPEPGVVLTYPVGIGRDDWATPLGVASVTDRITRPTWYPPASIRREHAEIGDPLPAVVPPGPDNPLGEYALLLSMDGYLIHGTNKPAGVGMQVSHGCIRLYPEDIETLFPIVEVGTPVRIVDQPVLAGWQGDKLYLQSYVDAQDVQLDDFNKLTKNAVASAVERRVSNGMAMTDLDDTQLTQLAGAPRGIAVKVNRQGMFRKLFRRIADASTGK